MSCRFAIVMIERTVVLITWWATLFRGPAIALAVPGFSMLGETLDPRGQC